MSISSKIIILLIMTKKAQVLINTLSLVKRELEKFTSSIPGKDNVWQTQRIAVLATVYIL